MKREDPQFKLRLPADLKSRLDHEGALNNRSLSAEIVARLQASLESSPNAISASLEAKLEELQKGLKRIEKLMVPVSTEAKPKGARPPK